MLTVTFILLLLTSFTILLAGTRSASPNKSLKLRLVAIRDATVDAKTGAPLLDLTQERSSRKKLEQALGHYRVAQALERLILHAGSGTTVAGILLASLGIAAGAALLTFLFISLLPAAGIAFIAGGLIPLLSLRFMRARRLSKFSALLPEAIDLMARSLRAGHSVGAAIEVVAEQSPEPLGSEFGRVFQQQRFGLRSRDALLEMADRVPSADLHFLITAILVQRETGGDLTEILDRTTHVIRERVRIEGEVRVYTAQGRLTGWILSLLPVALLLLINIISPGYSHLLFTDPTGQKMLYVGGGLIAVGAFLISRIVDIKI